MMRTPTHSLSDLEQEVISDTGWTESHTSCWRCIRTYRLPFDYREGWPKAPYQTDDPYGWELEAHKVDADPRRIAFFAYEPETDQIADTKLREYHHAIKPGAF